jgi:hypothetical protein
MNNNPDPVTLVTRGNTAKVKAKQRNHFGICQRIKPLRVNGVPLLILKGREHTHELKDDTVSSVFNDILVCLNILNKRDKFNNFTHPQYMGQQSLRRKPRGKKH